MAIGYAAKRLEAVPAGCCARPRLNVQERNQVIGSSPLICGRVIVHLFCPDQGCSPLGLRTSVRTLVEEDLRTGCWVAANLNLKPIRT